MKFTFELLEGMPAILTALAQGKRVTEFSWPLCTWVELDLHGGLVDEKRNFVSFDILDTVSLGEWYVFTEDEV